MTGIVIITRKGIEPELHYAGSQRILQKLSPDGFSYVKNRNS